MPLFSNDPHLHRSKDLAPLAVGALLCLSLIQGAGICQIIEPSPTKLSPTVLPVGEGTTTDLFSTVTDSDGKPIPLATVCLSAVKEEQRDQTDILGQYDFAIATDIWKLLAHMEHYASLPGKVLTDANTKTKKGLALTPRTCLVSGPKVDATWASDKIQAQAGLGIIGPDPPVASNRSQVTFQCVCYDTSGQKLTVGPRWNFQPDGVGEIACSRDGRSVTFDPHRDFIGQVTVSLTDTLSGQTVQFNASDSLPSCDRGLAVYHLLCGDDTEAIVGDGQDFRLTIPQGAIPHGDTSLIFLRKPPVLELKRITPGYQVWGQIYHLQAGDDVPFLRPLELSLPIVPQAISREPFVGQWNHQHLEWEPIGGTVAGDEVCAQTDHLSQFAVLSVSASLGLSAVELLPNPFTPNDPYGLQLAFTLTSDHSRKPFVTIRIYNMAGRLVRTICENEPVPKGAYLPGESFLDGKGRDITMWDGRTDSGELARNGRYLCHFRADDGDGTVEVFKTAVLIK